MPKVRELVVQYRPHPSGAMTDDRQLSDPVRAAAVLLPMLQDQPQEIFVCLHLNVKRQLLGVQEVARGDLSEVIVSPRVILTACLGERNSAAIILGHNHPSGDPTPSADDLEITRKIQQACRIFDIVLLDHLIIGDQDRGFISLKQTGRMEYL